jgi:hypothetical protein
VGDRDPAPFVQALASLHVPEFQPRKDIKVPTLSLSLSLCMV